MNKEVINFYARHVEAVVSRLKGKVKYWLTYNEINLAYCQSDWWQELIYQMMECLKQRCSYN
ncbi:MAG: family 1 glycosylhydrolase [Thomasclavelia ramosa]